MKPYSKRTSCLAATVTLAGLLISCTPATTTSAAEAPQQWAVLIGVKTHDDPAYNLRYTDNDVKQLREILVKRAGISADRILEMTDYSDPLRQPTLKNLRREVPRHLAQAGENDQVLIFFSGHGCPEDDDTYLVPRDFHKASAKTTGLPAAEMRQALAKCPAKVKFLILDCCHAGRTKSPGVDSLAAETVAKAIAPPPIPGCMVLASCRDEETSQEWPARRHGIFTYWLCRALEGGADKDGNGQLTFDEIYEYTDERVRTTAKQAYGVPQSPVKWSSDPVAGIPTVLSLRPEQPETLCRRLAEHVDLEIRRRDIKRVGVLEFVQPLGQFAGLASANLPTYFSENVQVALVALAGSDYTVVDADRMRAAAKGLTVQAVGNRAQMQSLRERAGGLDALVTGFIRQRGLKLHVQCELVDAADGDSLVTPTGILQIGEDLASELAGGMINRERPAGDPYDAAVVSYVLDPQPPPMQVRDDPRTQDLDESFPFRVELWSIEGEPGAEITPETPRKRKEFVVVQKRRAAGDPQPKKSELLVAARENEIVEIRIINRYRQRAGMTLLIDGINILGQRRERLGRAWSWVLNPSNDPTKPRVHTYAGWHIPKHKAAKPGEDTDFTLKRFQFVDVSESVAARQHYGDSIGLITAAFYWERGRAVGMGEGPEEERNLRTANFHAGRLMGTIKIRYVDERDLDRLLDDS